MHTLHLNIDDKIYNKFLSMLKNFESGVEVINNTQEVSLTKEQKKLLDLRQENYLLGKSKSYKWEDAKVIIQKSRSLN